MGERKRENKTYWGKRGITKLREYQYVSGGIEREGCEISRYIGAKSHWPL